MDADLPNNKIVGPDDGDISFRSSDGITYRAHKVLLKYQCQGLPPADCQTTDDGCYLLPESGATLDNLFHYLYPEIFPAPLTTDLTFDDISKITQAIEKYQMSKAGEFWSGKLLDSAATAPLAALEYAAHNSNEKLLRRVAPLVAKSDTPMHEILVVLPQALWGKWPIGLLPEYHRGDIKPAGYCSCSPSWLNIKQLFPSPRLDFLRKLGSMSGIIDLGTIDDYLASMADVCKDCCHHTTASPLQAWRDQIQSSLEDAIRVLDFQSLNPPVSNSAENPTQTSRLFDFDDADITISSSDGVRFNLHRKNLEVCCGVFPPSSHPTMDEVVYLTESRLTLEALFQFIYPRQQPDWDNMQFSGLYELAEAAEKYQVFSAMSVCKMLMRQFVTTDTAKVFAYSSKHGHDALANQSALSLLKSGVDARGWVHLLTPTAFLAWVRYVEHARSLCRKAVSSVPEVAITMLQKKRPAQNNSSSAANLAPELVDLSALFRTLPTSSSSGTLPPFTALSSAKVAKKSKISSSCSRCKLPLFNAIANPLPIALKQLGTSSVDVLWRIDLIWSTLDESMKLCTPTESFQQALEKWKEDMQNDINNIPPFTRFM